MAILDALVLPHRFFDPENPDHRRAYLMLYYKGQQHDTLRFVLETPYLSVLHMMQAKMSAYICRKEIEELDINTEMITHEGNAFVLNLDEQGDTRIQRVQLSLVR